MKVRRTLLALLVGAVVAMVMFMAFHGAGVALAAQAQQAAPPTTPAATAPADQSGAPTPAAATGDQAAATTPATTTENQAPGTAAVLRTESKLVRVDVVVTDKKGNYVKDLTANDFEVFEDNKQQRVSSFSFGTDPSGPAGSQRHYMILFFDNSTMDPTDQGRARQSAAKFIDANAGPDRVMAIVNFGGTVQIAQNFTADSERLKAVVMGMKTSAVNPNAASPSSTSASAGAAIATPMMGMPSLGNPEADFGARSVLLGIRSMAKNLANIPGRKSLVLFSSGFPLNAEIQSELTATIDACNKANVAVYPLDVRGLVAPMSSVPRMRDRALGAPGIVLAAYHPSGFAATAPQQHGGGGGGGVGGGGGTGGGGGRGGSGGGTGGGTGGGSGGGTGGGGGKGSGGGSGSGGTGSGGKGGSGGTGTGGGSRGGFGPTSAYPGMAQPNMIVPAFPESASTNQQILYSLAEGTGGFPIVNSNDLVSGLEKINREQDQYYLLGYAPENSPEGSCHTLKVKAVHGMNVRARSGYCNVRPTDVLAGNPVVKTLESRAAGTAAGNIAGTMEAPFVYSGAAEATVHLALDVPSASIPFNKVKGKYHTDLDVLGIAYRPDGTVGARFSDKITLDLEKDDWKRFTAQPWFYENQLAIAPGQYRLAVVISGSEQNFGKFEKPLAIDPYDGKKFTISGIILSKDLVKASGDTSGLDSELMADRIPLIVKGLEVVPSGSNHFKKTDKVVVFAQVYDPQLTDENAKPVQFAYRVVETKTNKPFFATGLMDAASYELKGNPVIPVALKVPVDDLAPGTYRLDMQALQTGGESSTIRSVEFAVE